MLACLPKRSQGRVSGSRSAGLGKSRAHVGFNRPRSWNRPKEHPLHRDTTLLSRLSGKKKLPGRMKASRRWAGCSKIQGLCYRSLAKFGKDLIPGLGSVPRAPRRPKARLPCACGGGCALLTPSSPRPADRNSLQTSSPEEVDDQKHRLGLMKTKTAAETLARALLACRRRWRRPRGL